MSKDIKSELLPNTFPCPNWVIDMGIWAMLGDKERACYTVFLRKTIGWWKHTDRISMSQLEEFTGLAQGTVRQAMKNLEELRLVILVSENDPRLNYGKEWGYQPDHKLVDVQALVDRTAKNKNANMQRTAAATQARLDALSSDVAPNVGRKDGTNVTRQGGTNVGRYPQNHLSIPSIKTKELKADKPPAKPTTPTKKASDKPWTWSDKNEQYKPLADAFIKCTRPPLNSAEMVFWLFGNPRSNVKGLKQYYDVGISPAELVQAYDRHVKKDKLSCKGPGSIFYKADEIHQANGGGRVTEYNIDEIRANARAEREKALSA